MLEPLHSCSWSDAAACKVEIECAEQDSHHKNHNDDDDDDDGDNKSLEQSSSYEADTFSATH